MKKASRRELLQSFGTLGFAAFGGALLPSQAYPWVGTRMRKRTSGSAMQIAQNLQLTTGLKVCLDAGDATSLSATSSQTWSDLSGNGNHFFLGNDTSSSGDDPTFSGNIGNRSQKEYFLFDGGDYFKYSLATPSWVNDLHKDNAQCTFAAWIYLSGTGSVGFIGTSSTSADPGFFWGRSSGDTIIFQVNKDIVSSALAASGGALVNNEWLFLSCSVNEPGGAGASNLGINTTFTTFNGTYNSPSTADTVNLLGLGCRRGVPGGGSAVKVAAGTRMAIFFVWSGTYLTQTQLISIYNATKRRFGK